MNMFRVLKKEPRHEDVWVSGVIAPRILNLGTRWKWVMVNFMPQALYLCGKSPRYLMYRRLGGPLSRSGGGGEDKNKIPTPADNWSPVVQLVA
jgi:hypothetical protein